MKIVLMNLSTFVSLCLFLRRINISNYYILKALAHLNKYFFKYRVRLLLGIVFVTLSNLFAVYTAPLVRYAVDFIKETADSGNFDSGVVSKQLLFYSGLLLGAALLNGLFMFLMRQTIIVMSRLIEYDLKNEVYLHYQRLDTRFYKKNNTGDIMNRISEDVSRVRMYVGPAVMYIVNTLGTFIITITFMLNENVKMTLYVLTPLPVLSIIIYYVSNTINKKSTLVQEQLSDLSSFSQESFAGMRVIKAFAKEEQSVSELREKSIEYKKRSMSLAYTNSLFQPAMILLIGISNVITIYVGGMEAINGNATVGNIAEFLVYVNRLTWPVAALGWVSSLIQRAAASQKRINDFLQTNPDIKDPESAIDVTLGNIRFNNVSFTYPDTETAVLKNVSFEIPEGKTLAIIGRTGSGKSTIAQLLCRMYDVSSGDILIGETPISSVKLSSLRSSIGYVPQEVFLFSDTIANNIAFSTESARPFTKERIEQSAKDAGIYEDILAFKEGFNTVVGERGVTLSGGQKQRISIARALIKEPGVLVFDDCLSAVDTVTEERILDSIKRIMKGKTCLIIGHRVSSVQHADEIIVLENGAIAERGDHQSLLEKNGIYAETYRSQLIKETGS